MRTYEKIHETKEAANAHISKIKERGGVVKKTIKDGKTLLRYSFKQTPIKGKEVWQHFLSYGSENHSKDENPMYDWEDQILKTEYLEKEIKITDLLKNDADLNEFISSETEDNISDYKKGREVTKNIIIGNSNYAKDVVIDGYHRIAQNIVSGKNYIKAFVPTTSRYAK